MSMCNDSKVMVRGSTTSEKEETKGRPIFYFTEAKVKCVQ